MIKQPVSVIVCRVGRLPVVEPLVLQNGHYLDAIQALVGGLAQSVVLEDGLECWFNEEAISRGLPQNRILMTAMGHAEMFRGDFFLAKFYINGIDEYFFVDVDESDWLRYLSAFEAEDIETSKRLIAARLGIDVVNGSSGKGSG